MKSGIMLKAVKLRDEREAVIRTPTWEDLDDFLAFIHVLIDEDGDITTSKKPTREEEADWLAARLKKMEREEVVCIVAEAEGRLVANSEVTKKPGRMSHVGILSISVSRGYRDLGLGHYMMEALIQESRNIGLELQVLDVFATNERAIHLYEKLGFQKIGRLRRGVKKDEWYVDLIRMSLEI
jgi:ribosomal protein S18 acetylase RimI-like enzyme